MRNVPWHVKGVRPDAREVARDAARRSGLSVGEWLNSLIIDAAAHDDSAADDDREPVPPGPHLQPNRDDSRFMAIRRDIDELKWQIDRLSQGHGPRTAPPFDQGDALGGAKLAESIARIEQQLQGLNRNGRPPGADHASYDAGHQRSSERNLGVDDAFAEIAARQQLLDAESPETQPFGAPAVGHEAPGTQADPSPIEQQLRDIGARIKALQGASRCDSVATEIARTIEHAAPKRAIEAVEEQLRRLTTQLESMRPPAQMDQVVESLRRDMAEIGRRINDAMPQRAVAAIEEQIRALSSEVAGLQRPPRAEDIADILRKDFAEFRASHDNVPPPPHMAAIEEQVRALTGEVAKLHPPLRVEDIATALRRDLDEIGAVLTNAIPQRAVASIEEQVQALNAQISRLHASPPMDEIAQVLRQDLVEIGAVLHDAMPTSAIAALEQEVRTLGERLEANRGSVVESPTTAEFEHALAEIRDRLRVLTPAEDLAELSQAVKSLSRRADAIGPDGTAPEMLHQLEHAIGALHGLASQVASQDAVAGLSRDIHSLGDKIDRGSRQTDPDIMVTLERRLAEMAEAVGRSRPAEGPAIPANFDAVFKTLADRLEATQLPAADQGALKNLEQRIVKLVDKLEESEARIGRQDGAERGMEELLAQLKELRVQNEHKLQAIQQQLVTSTAEAISAPAEAIRRDVATLKEIQASTDRRTQDTFEAVYGTIEQVVDRLATIEEGLRGRPAADHTAGSSAAPLAAPLTAMRGPFGESSAPSGLPTTVTVFDAPAMTPPAAPVIEPPRTGKGAGFETRARSGPRSAAVFSGETTLGQMPTSGVLPDLAAPAPLPRPVAAPASTPAAPDMTGSLTIRNPLLQGPASRDAPPPPAPAVQQTAPAHDLNRGSLPATIGGKALLAAAVAGEPGASYEVAVRFAEGRNVPQDLAQAAAWFDHAARSGLAPAQFRLGSMYEKGLGVRKDLQEARRLYLAATDKGNAKAMHNLAVLYAEGLEGKPDYAVASQWFRKAAAYGVVDSQYNLAILYARGVGIERNIAESYKWFALAAKGGDKDAAKKRDEVAARLDPPQLESAKQAAESFVPEQQSDEATSTKAPPGGWDQVVAAGPTKSRAR